MSLLNQAAVEALCSATYLENYLDTLDTLPDDLQRIVSQMREIDFQYNELLKEIENQKDIVQADNNPDSLQTKKASISLQRHLIRSQELGDEQLQLSSLLIEYIENRTRQLEQDLENLDPSLGRDPELDTTSVTVTPSKTSKNDHHEHQHKEKKKPHRRKTHDNNSTNNNKKDDHEELVAPPPKKKVKHQQQQQHQVTATITHQEEKPKEVVKKKKKRKVKKENKEGDKSPLNFPIDPDEPVYCSCHQVSYGEMIGCDFDGCEIEWFHFNCVNLTTKPKGKWFCPDCRGDRPNIIRPDLK